MHNTSWDKRVWLLTFGVGNLCGFLYLLGNYPPWQRRLGVGDNLENLMILLGSVLLPGIVSGIARQRFFLWGLAPLVVMDIWNYVEDVMEGGIHQVITDTPNALMSDLPTLILVILPISLYRSMQRRKAERTAALQQALRDATSVPQEGVWPPPPQRGTNRTE